MGNSDKICHSCSGTFNALTVKKSNAKKMKLLILLFIYLNLARDSRAFNFTCSSESDAKTLRQRNFGQSKWPNAIVKYELHSSLTATDISEFNKAIDVYHKKTCVRFERRSNGEAAYVSIENDPTTCGLAHVCRTGGYQFARFGGDCRKANVMVHELGHTLCFGHEQSRADRDDYLSYPCNDAGGKDTGFDTMGLFYDYRSSMHYGCNNCMVPKMADVTTSMCGGDYLSVLDVEKINAFYDCSGCLGYRFRPLSRMTAAEKADLLPAGTDIDGQTLYVCRVYQNGDIIPGKGNINNGRCWVGWGQKEFLHTSAAEFLTKGKSGNSLTWVQKPSNNVIPSNAIAGGRTRDAEPLYIARATLDVDGRSSKVVGKVHATKPDRVFATFNGLEYIVFSFEFLQCS